MSSLSTITRFSWIALGLGAALFAIACLRGVLALGEADREAASNAQKRDRIVSLDAEYRTYLADEIAMGRLLDQAEKAGRFDAEDWFVRTAEDVKAPPPRVTVRTLPGSIGGRLLAETTVVWEDVAPHDFQKVLAAAESREPPLRLRSVEVKARTGGRASVKAVFATFQ